MPRSRKAEPAPKASTKATTAQTYRHPDSERLLKPVMTDRAGSAGASPASPRRGDHDQSQEPDPWRSRGYLPHFDGPEAVQSINFRLADALPAAVVEAMRHDPRIRSDALRRQRLEEYLDAGHGACHLRHPAVGRMVEETLLLFDGERYRLCAWSVMPNHVHALIAMRPEFPLWSVLHSWKSFTSKEANRLLGRRGTFWEVEYFDRYIRDEEHFWNAVRYIEERNRSPFSSATRRKRSG